MLLSKEKDFALYNETCARGHTELLDILISQGLEIEGRSLGYAIKNKQLLMVKKLTSLGIKPGDWDVYWAVDTNSLEIVKYLISINTPFSKNTFDWARYRNNKDIINLLKNNKELLTKKQTK